MRRTFSPLILLLLGSLVACMPVATPNPTPRPIISETPSPIPTPITTPISTPAAGIALPSVVDVVEKVKPAVVSITTETVELNLFLQPIPRRGAGSGIIFSPDGYILTNNHVIEGAKKITVTIPKSHLFPKEASLPAEVIGRDKTSDLAVIKVDATNLPVAQFSSSSQLRVGDWVVAIGNALALPGGPTVSLGIVSALGRSISVGDVIMHDLIQTDAAINPGNSGGPLVNLKGEVVGINTAIIAGTENIGFAISTDTAIPIRDELLKFGEIRWPWLGVQITDLTPSLAKEIETSADEGTLIIKVFQGTPAERAGLRAEDVIIKFGGIDTPDLASFQKAIRKFRAGESAEVVFIRKDQKLSTWVTLAQAPSR